MYCIIAVVHVQGPGAQELHFFNAIAQIKMASSPVEAGDLK
jgi:hypothetical protein